MPSPSAPPTSVLCPPGWTSFVGSELSCVFVVNTPMTAVDAAAACSEVASGHLVTILEDGMIAQTILSLTDGMHVWVGASRNVSEPNRLLGWSWVDGSAGADQLMNCGKTGCGAWAAGQPRQVLIVWFILRFQSHHGALYLVLSGVDNSRGIVLSGF